jgi:hypothetical protein
MQVARWILFENVRRGNQFERQAFFCKPNIIYDAWILQRTMKVDKRKVHLCIMIHKQIVVDDQNCHSVIGLRFGPVLNVVSCVNHH